MTLDSDLDALYAGLPEDFVARRKELAAAAKARGDTGAAKAIAGARRPTTAAWVVNALVHGDPTVRRRVTDFTAELRAAHAAMDGNRIRELTRAQRALVSELVRAAFVTTGLSAPTGALRDDVTGTLQAAIADPDVATRLGRLEKAEQWSGFGDFGVSAEVGAPRRRAPDSTPAVAPVGDGERLREMEHARASAAAEVAAAESAFEAATATVADRTAALATARRRYEKILETLSSAEHDVDAADAALDAARDSADGAERALVTAKASLSQLDSEIATLTGESPT